jgi:hypothetical protein
MRSLDSFSRGPARFIIVNDGEVEVPALLLSQEMFTIMDNAVTADYRHDKQQQKNRDKILKHMNDIDNTRGYIATLDIQIKHLKHSAKRSGKKMDNDITSQLEYLIGSKATGIRRVKTMRKIIKRLDKERTESEENLRKKWKSLDLVTEEVWERAGFFDMEEVWQNAGHSEIGKQQATSQPRPRQVSYRTSFEIRILLTGAFILGIQNSNRGHTEGSRYPCKAAPELSRGTSALRASLGFSRTGIRRLASIERHRSYEPVRDRCGKG